MEKTDREVWLEYEREKKKLEDCCSSREQYERELKDLANRLGV